ncbi:hypothetical protein QUF94_22225 [Peribacillus sp. NJ4]|nr:MULTISPECIES: hypothetical protein [unclassified Peribacillus]MDM5214123.1 hypothetical protein [Peribacillus sp. NJ4]MDM5219447.1 hypothetical protein [Peribacillus sp. NJ11]
MGTKLIINLKEIDHLDRFLNNNKEDYLQMKQTGQNMAGLFHLITLF